MYMHQMESEANVKLAQLKKAYNRLLERHTDLELECQALKTRLTRLQGGTELRSPPGTGMTESSFDFNGIGSDGMSSIVRGGDSAYDSYGEYNAQLEPPFSTASASDPIGRRYGAAIAAAAPSESVTSRAATMSSRNSTQLVMYNQTAPLDDSASVRSPRSENSGDTAKEKKAANKIQPSSEIRVYGRGMLAHGGVAFSTSVLIPLRWCSKYQTEDQGQGKERRQAQVWIQELPKHYVTRHYNSINDTSRLGLGYM